MRIGMAATAGLLAGWVFLLASPVAPAGAASGYPPPSNLNTSCSFSQVIDVGGSATVNATCTFAPGSTITISYNGAAYATATAPASGVFTEVFTVASDPTVSLNGGPAEAATFGATETFVASGTNPSGGTNVVTTYVTIPTAAATASSTGALAFTGADIAATVGAGVALLAMGFAMVMLARRRGDRGHIA